MTTRRSLFSLFTAAPIALLAQNGSGQTARPTAIDQNQVRGLPLAADNWLSYVPPQVPDGTITVFVLPVSPRKVEVYVNGLRQAQQSEVLAGTRFDFAWAGNTITFQPGVQRFRWLAILFVLVIEPRCS